MKGHEETDINIRAIAWVVALFILAAVVVHFAVWWIFGYYRDEELRRDVRRTGIEGPPPIPPQPRLQVNPEHEWKEFYDSQQQMLRRYEWVSREDGRVRIPIDRAIELLVEREGQGKRD